MKKILLKDVELVNVNKASVVVNLNGSPCFIMKRYFNMLLRGVQLEGQVVSMPGRVEGTENQWFAVLSIF